MQRVTRMWRPPRLRKRKAKNQAAREAWSVLPRIRPYLKGQWRLATASTILLIFSALFALLEPWPLALLIDGVLGNEPPPSWLRDIFGDGRFTLLGVAVGLGFIVTAGIHGLAVLSDYVNTKLDQRMVLDFRSDLFRHSHKLSFGWHSNRSTGQLMNRINLMASSIGAVTMSFPPMAESLFTIIGMFIVAFTIDSQLTLLAMTVVPFVYYSIGRYTNRVLPDVQRVKAMEGQNLNIVHEAMSMIRVIVAFGRERHEYRRFRDQGERTIDARVRVTVRQTLFSMAVAIITAAGTGLVLWFGASNVLRGRLSVGQLLVVISYIAAVYTPLQGISSSFATLQEQVVGLQMSFDLLDIAPEVKETPNATAIGRAQGHVTFDNVSFSYRGRKGTLRGVSFEAKPGEAIALVGPTGGGKSTLVSLIPRFYDPEDGRILLDGHDLRDLTLGSLRRQISIVLQEPQLFSGTIEDNIRYGHLEASEDEVVEAAKAANAHDFIMRLPKKYKTRVGEGGAQLSGGERQRISIARAFIRDTPILILDEPTSSIDSKTEEVILDALGRIMEGRTTFVIAHRLSTVHHADRYLVVQDGGIVEQGTHDELFARGGLYRQLWDLQVRRRGRRRISPAEETLTGKITEMARSLQSPEQEVRAGARQALRSMDQVVVRDWAEEALRSEDQSQAALGASVSAALKLIGHGSALLERAAASAPADRRPFTDALRALKLESLALVQLLDKVAPQDAGNAVHVVRRVGGADALPLLSGYLEHPNPSMRASVLNVLASSGEPDVVSAAENAALHDASPRVRTAAFAVLRSLPWERRRSFFQRGLNDSAPQVRARAMSLLPVRLDEEVVPPILIALGDGHERVWREARKYLLRLDEDELRTVRTILQAYVLGRQDALDDGVDRALPDVNLERVLGIVRGALSEPIADELLTREEAAERGGVSLGTITRLEREGRLITETVEAGPKRLVRVRSGDLVSALGNGHTRDRKPAGRSRTARALRPLVRALDGVETRRGLVGAQIVVRLLGEDPFLRRLQTGVEPDQRIAALDALTLLGGWAAAAVLTSAASDPWTAVRAHALELLAEVRDPDAAKALKRAYEGVRKGTTPGSSRDAEIAALGHALKQTSRDGNGRAAAPPNGGKNLTRSAAGSTG